MNNFNLNHSYDEFSENDNDKLKIYIKYNENIEFLFVSGELENNNFYGSLKYYGSSSRLGEKYEIYNSIKGYKKMEMRIVNYEIEIANFELDFKELALKNLEDNKGMYNEDHKKIIKENIDKDKLCILNSFSNIEVIKGDIMIKLGLRDLYKFDGNVELCSVMLKILD